MSPEGRTTLINTFLDTVSNPDDLETEDSPQNLARTWIIDLDPLYICPLDPGLIQRYVMAVFYYSTGGGSWSQCSAPPEFDKPEVIDSANMECNITAADGKSNAWLTPNSVCDWGGVGCNGDEESVNRIDFGKKQQPKKDDRNIVLETLRFTNFCASPLNHFSRTELNRVAGTLPTEINRLQSLQFLLLERGALTGTIPRQIGDIRTLQEINLNFNRLSGSIPNSLYFLNNLEQLSLSDNNLVGAIGTRIGRLLKLDLFQIQNNTITGKIPTQMGLLPLLRTCILNKCSHPLI